VLVDVCVDVDVVAAGANLRYEEQKVSAAAFALTWSMSCTSTGHPRLFATGDAKARASSEAPEIKPEERILRGGA